MSEPRKLATILLGNRLAMILIATFLALAGAAVAGLLEDAHAAYKRGDFATALRLLRPLADQGDAMAQFWLGVMYDHAQGVPQDYAEAVKWYRKAASQRQLSRAGDCDRHSRSKMERLIVYAYRRSPKG